MKSKDIRLYFGRKSRRQIQPDCKQVFAMTDNRHCNVPMIAERVPLYEVPRSMEKPIAQGIGGLMGKSFVSNTTISTDERTKLVNIIKRIYPSFDVQVVPKDLDSLECHLIFRLFEHELCRLGNSSDEVIAQRLDWLRSGPFYSGISRFAKVINENSINTIEAQGCWDLLLVIEPVVRVEPLFQQDPSLNALILEQERWILHYGIWQKEYPLYYLLQQEAGHKRPRTRRDSVGSPSKALRSMTCTPLGENGSLTSLEFFFRKFLRSMAAIIDRTVRELGLGSSVQHITWTLFMSALEDELELRLLHKRHALTIVACAVYSIAKLFDQDRSFSQIITCLHAHFPHYNDHWYKQILDDQGIHGDLVKFYNCVYLERMRSRIYAFRQPQTPQKSSNPNPIPFPTTTCSVAVSRNVYLDISPRPRHVSSAGSPTCISILGNLGVRKQTKNDAGKMKGKIQKSVVRRLDFAEQSS